MRKLSLKQPLKIPFCCVWPGNQFSGVALILFLGFLFSSAALAKDIKFEAGVDQDKTSLGSSIQLNLAFNGQNVPAFDLPQIDGFQSRYLGPSSMMSIVNGQVSSSITHMYTLLPTKTGTFKLGPFKFEHNGDNYISNEIQIEVLDGQVNSAPVKEPEQAPAIGDISDRIFVLMQVKKDKLYLNEITQVALKLYVNRLGVRDIQLPQIDHDGFSIGEFGRPKEYQEAYNGINYDVIEFDADLFALRPGDLKLGPAHLKCNLITKKQRNSRNMPGGLDSFFNDNVFDDFFGGYEAYPMDLKSQEIPMTALALPQDNKPQDFSGALGHFDLDVAVSPQEVKAGDPITIRSVISGEGNFGAVNSLTLSDKNNFKVYDPQAKQEPGKKAFEQVLIPLNTSVKEAPAVSFSYFDTGLGQYQSLSRGPFPIKVSQPDIKEEQKIVEPSQAVGPRHREEKLGRDIVYIKDSLGELRPKGKFFYKDFHFRFLLSLFFMIYLAALYLFNWKTRLANDPRYARALWAPGKARQGLRQARADLAAGKVNEFYDVVFNTLQEYLGGKFHLASKGITVSIVDDTLKSKGYPDDLLAKLKDIFRDCDMARFAPGKLRQDDMRASLRKLEEAIDYIQKHKA